MPRSLTILLGALVLIALGIGGILLFLVTRSEPPAGATSGTAPAASAALSRSGAGA